MKLFDDILAGRTAPLEAFEASLGDALPLLHRLRETPQDPEWHAEGDVRTHTAWVLEEAWSLLGQAEWASLSAPRRLALIVSAALHDIAKPLTTQRREIEGRERVVAPRHAARGRSYLAPRLAGLGLAPEVLREVLALVALHHDPKLLVLRDRPAGAWRQVGAQVDVPLLYLLEQADMRGRACPDKAEQLELIDLFRLGAEEHGLWGGDPWRGWREALRASLEGEPFAVAEHVTAEALRLGAAGEVQSVEEALGATWGLRQRGGGRLTILCGPSGSGKSRWAAAHRAEAEVVSLDALRVQLAGGVEDQSRNGEVVRAGKERVKAGLRAGREVVWDGTSLRREGRAQLAQLARGYGVMVEIVVFLVPCDDLAARMRGRGRAVPAGVLARQVESWEWPGDDEAHRLVVVGPQGEVLWST